MASRLPHNQHSQLHVLRPEDLQVVETQKSDRDQRVPQSARHRHDQAPHIHGKHILAGILATAVLVGGVKKTESLFEGRETPAHYSDKQLGDLTKVHSENVMIGETEDTWRGKTVNTIDDAVRMVNEGEGDTTTESQIQEVEHYVAEQVIANHEAKGAASTPAVGYGEVVVVPVLPRNPTQ